MSSTPAELQSAIDRLRASVAPIPQTIADTNALTAKLGKVQQLGADARAVAAELDPVKRDLDARTARNVTLRAKLADLKKRKGIK